MVANAYAAQKLPLRNHFGSRGIADLLQDRLKFALVMGSEGVLVGSSLYQALEALGVRAELKPNGVKLYRDGVWGLLAAALQQSPERGEEPELPAGVALLKARPERRYYVFLAAEDASYIYSVLRVGG